MSCGSSRVVARLNFNIVCTYLCDALVLLVLDDPDVLDRVGCVLGLVF